GVGGPGRADERALRDRADLDLVGSGARGALRRRREEGVAAARQVGGEGEELLGVGDLAERRLERLELPEQAVVGRDLVAEGRLLALQQRHPLTLDADERLD